jgi:hypothetical protein
MRDANLASFVSRPKHRARLRRGDPEGRYAPVKGSGTKRCLCHDARIREQLVLCRGIEDITLVREGRKGREE